MKKLRSKLVLSKIFVHRSLSYVAIINAGMLLFLVLSQLELYGIDVEITRWFIPIFICTIFLMILFGYLEDKLGFFQEEAKTAAKRNPYFNDIVDRLDRIEKKMDKK